MIYQGKYLAVTLLLTFQTLIASSVDQETFKSKFSKLFFVGTALDSAQIEGKSVSEIALVNQQFNSIVAENCMKSEKIQPAEGKFDFSLADKFVKFGTEHKMNIIGHTLVWHSQTPKWLFINADGTKVSREVLIERMKKHIYTVVGRYKGKVHGWDVVNEALEEDGSLRKSKWLEIIGPDYIELAFRFAHEADPKAELYYNDYNLYQPSKRDGAVRIIENLKHKGCRIDGVGEQGHYALDRPVFENLEQSIIAFAKHGVKVNITELDVTMLPFPTGELTADVSLNYKNKPEYNPYVKGVPDEVQKHFNNYYIRLFELFVKHRKVIDRVTFWGVNDGQSWRNYWPINERMDYPLLFERNNKAKPAVAEIFKLVK